MAPADPPRLASDRALAGPRPPARRSFDAVILAGSIAFLLVARGLEVAREADGRAAVSAAGWRLPSLCAFRTLTGLPCPGCGLTRSLNALMRGDASEACRWHPLGPLVLLLLLAQIPYRLLVLLRPGTPRLRISSTATGVLVGGGWIALVLIWVVRLAGGWLPS